MDNKVLRRILRYTRPYWFYLLLAIVSALLGTSLSLYVPVLIGRGVDLIAGAGMVDFPGVMRILLQLGCTAAISALFQWFLGLCTNNLSHRTVRDMRVDAFARISHLPLSYIDSHAHGDLISRVINDMEKVSDGLLQGFTQLFSGIVTIVGTLIFMLTLDWGNTLVVVLLTPLSLFVASFIARNTYTYFKQSSNIQGELGAYIEEMVGGQKVVKAFGYEDRAQATFEEINERLHKSGQIAHFFSAITNPCTRFVNGLVYAAVGITGAISAVNGRISIGDISAFLAYANQYTKPFNEISGVVTELTGAFAAARRVFAIMDAPTETPVEKEMHLADCMGHIQMDDISFAYDPERPLIQHLKLEAQPGQRIAIVGPTGCGKTTLINLLMRFYDVNDGEIRVDGVPIPCIPRGELRRKYGMVLQDTWLFAGTIQENIAYGKETATLEEVVAAAKAAHAHSFIQRLPQGYDTLVSEEGGNLSQGQRQLLSIARVMLTDPAMLILDEATSSIDTLTELRIQRAFQKMTQGRTSFVVAHRLSTIREADCILVMDAGHIVEQGTHKELLAKGGFYARLYNAQFAKTQP